VPLAVITITLDPVLRLSDTSSVRYETIALALVLLLGLVVAARIASRTPAGEADDPDARLRIDDLVFISVGAVPGAIIGGRLGYVLDHLDFYRSNTSAILDPAQGGLTLTLAVPLGILTGALIARLLGAPVGRWMGAAALPLLFILSAGKLVGVLGGTGQGGVTDLAWATAFAGPGPWGSLAAELPAHPAQVYEGILVAVTVPILYVLSRFVGAWRRTGAPLLIALGLWAAVRLVIAATWRDPVAVGPLRVEQALALVVLLVAGIGLASRGRASVEATNPSLDAGSQPA
jgi:phosphatidylglycerol---prolipoprotein diacylglyceryl transferase